LDRLPCCPFLALVDSREYLAHLSQHIDEHPSTKPRSETFDNRTVVIGIGWARSTQTALPTNTAIARSTRGLGGTLSILSPPASGTTFWRPRSSRRLMILQRWDSAFPTPRTKARSAKAVSAQPKPARSWRRLTFLNPMIVRQWSLRALPGRRRARTSPAKSAGK